MTQACWPQNLPLAASQMGRHRRLEINPGATPRRHRGRTLGTRGWTSRKEQVMSERQRVPMSMRLTPDRLRRSLVGPVAAAMIATVVTVSPVLAVDTDMTISATVVDFGSVDVGTTSAPVPVVLTNRAAHRSGPSTSSAVRRRRRVQCEPELPGCDAAGWRVVFRQLHVLAVGISSRGTSSSPSARPTPSRR